LRAGWPAWRRLPASGRSRTPGRRPGRCRPDAGRDPLGHAEGLIGDATARFVQDNARKLDDAVDSTGDSRFGYFGLRTGCDRYLLRHPVTRLAVGSPPYWQLQVACGLAQSPAEAIGFYRPMTSLAYLPSSPTLFNSGTRHAQMSSC
jgi:ribonucleoside-diphosphate reductase alpha chain